MNARAMNPRALAAAAMLVMAAAATASPSMAQTDKMPNGWMSRAAEMRTVMHYADGAWTSPAAVVLKSAKDWNDWNEEMVASGRAVGKEAMPDVDWSREAVLVVTLGQSQGPVSMDLKNGRRVGLRTEVELSLNWSAGGYSPCQVVAMDKRLARSVRLVNAEAAGLSAQVPAYSARTLANQSMSNPATAVAAASWGELKDMYRQ
jgi:hypothetical protein